MRVVIPPPTGTRHADWPPRWFSWPTEQLLEEATSPDGRMKPQKVSSNEWIAWLKAVVPIAVSNDSAKLYWDKSNKDVAYLRAAKPLPNQMLVRCIWNPQFRKRETLPDAVQIVTDQMYHYDDSAKLGRKLVNGNLKQRLPITDFKSCASALEGSVLADSFKHFPWQLTSVAEDLRFKTIKRCFTVTENRRSYRLTITFGPRGTLLQLEGVGFRLSSVAS